MALTPGVRLGPYEILAPLGAGAMGEVYRARDDRLNRDVAIKVLPSWAAADPEMLRRFETEARAAGGLNHPGIVSVHDVGRSEFGPFIVSELLEGETLRSRLRRGPLPEPEAIDFGRQFALALAGAHEQGIIHRDLKPENLFITTDGRLKILDFGIARLMPQLAPDQPTTGSAPIAATTPGIVLGTYGYMSPEQVSGLPVDQRSDIFSLGAVLYEMRSGRQPFSGRSHIEMANAVVGREPEPLTDTGPVLQQVIGQCLAKKAADRFVSARDVAAALGTGSDRHTAGPSVAPAHGRTHPSRRSTLLAGAAVLVLVAAGAWFLSGRLRGGPSAPVRITSLAVLPVASFSERPEDAYFADAMTEAMITDLARISSLTVTSRTSVMQYRGTTKTTREIASELGVAGVIEASFVKAGSHVAITAKLIDARADTLLWSRTYEREMQEVVTLQRQVARAISKEISATLTPQEEKYLDEARSVDPAAHEAYLRGRYEVNRFSETSLHNAIRYFNEAIAKDPGSARAYAGLADAYSRLRTAYVPPDTVMPQAKTAALKAVELDGSLAEARVALGFVLMLYDWDWTSAEREFKAAIQLNPSLATAHDGYGLLLAVLGRHDDAGAEIERAIRLDPRSSTVESDAAWIAYLARRYDLTVEHGKKAVALEPEVWYGYTMLGLGYEKLQKYTEATQALEKARSLDDATPILEMLGGLYAAQGRTADARRMLAEFDEQAKRRWVCPYEVATIHAGLGDRRETLAWLEKGHRERADCMPWMAVDPKLDLLRNDPGFQSLIRRAGLQLSQPGPQR